MRHRGGDNMDASGQFQGRGRAIITAFNSIEYAYEGDELTGEGRPSVFTEAVVEGLQTGKADLDMDHLVSVDDLYHDVYDRVRERTPNRTPRARTRSPAAPTRPRPGSRGTDATDGKQLCLTIRERPQSSGKSIDQAGAGGLLSADNYQELRVPYVAHGDGHRVDVHVTANLAGAVPGDAFLADAISLTPSDRTRIGTGC